MRDEVITLETAKLAKEKGFNRVLCYYVYDNNMLLGSTQVFNRENFILAPTQSLLQKWLREEHKINVESNYLPNIQKYRYIAKPMNIIPKHFKSFKEYHNYVYKYYGKINRDTYEDALEEGLISALNLIDNV